MRLDSTSDSTDRSFNSNSSNRPGKSGATERSQSTVKNSLDPNLVIGTAESKLKSALNDFDPIRRNATISQMLLDLTPANASEMLAAVENSPGGRENDRHFNDFLYAWARVSGEDALKYAMDPESPKRTRGDEMTAISGWAASDPNSAMSYVENVENPETRQWMHLGVTKEMIKNDQVIANDIIKIYSKDIFINNEVVSINGVVRKPGTYNLKTGMRIKDLILEAGGCLLYTSDAADE